MKYNIVSGERGIDIKRLYLPIKKYVKCPKCDIDHIIDMEKHYIIYPITNVPTTVFFNCPVCETPGQFDITITFAYKLN